MDTFAAIRDVSCRPSAQTLKPHLVVIDVKSAEVLADYFGTVSGFCFLISSKVVHDCSEYFARFATSVVAASGAPLILQRSIVPATLPLLFGIDGAQMKRTMALFSMVFQGLTGQAEELGAKERDLARILESMHFAEVMRSALQLGADRNPQSPASARFYNIIAMSDNQIISAGVPALFDVFTTEEARQVADFWASDTIAAMTKLQIAGDPAPLEKLTPLQREEFMRFTRSAGGAASERMSALLGSQEFLEEVVINMIGASEASRIFGQKPENR